MNWPNTLQRIACCWLVLLVITGASRGASSLGVSATAEPGAFPLVAAGQAAAIRVDSNDAEAVKIAAGMFADDVERVTGHRPDVAAGGTANSGLMVLIGTVGKSQAIDRLVSAGKLDVSPLKNKWEGYLLTIVSDPEPGVKQALVIAGSDRRGTAYGVFTLSKSIGVSPWYWWADVPVKKQSQLFISLPAPLSESPGVKYRGIFINDEDWGIHVWAKSTFDPDFKNIGPRTYEKVFELMLRLKLNYIWPAMHACTTEFAATPANIELADKFGIVAGASHCEPMLCNNVHWNAKTMGDWNYLTNRDKIHDYWEQSAKTRGGEEAVWTLGIRGIHDAGMETPPNDLPGKLKLMTQVISDQRDLLHQYATDKYGPPAQCFIPYKEVLPIYDAGLKVPDNVTLVWVDDNFGYIRRLSSPEEQKRSGGSGVYYHLSYYGQPHSYTWINTTAPALIWEELHKAWENQARTLWMLNVGDIKPAEIGIDYYSRLAWNPTGMGPDSQPRFLKDFAAENFGNQAAQPIADLLANFYRLGTIRKPELMSRPWAISLSVERAEELEVRYAALLHEEKEIAAQIPAEARDAYTETIGFPAQVLGTAGLIFLADRQVQTKKDVASIPARIEQLRDDLSAQVDNYNKNLAGGKWNHMMPGLVTGKNLTAWNSQVRWPWGEKPPAPREPNSEYDTSPPVPPSGQGWRPAADTNRQSAEGIIRWTEVAGLGPSGRAMSLQPTGNLLSNTPTLEFDFKAAHSGDAAAFIDFLPTFRIYPGMKQRVAVQVDSQAETMMEVPGSSGAENENGPVRNSAVQDNYVHLRVPMPALTAGPHTFKIRAIDPGAVIDQVSLP